MSVARAVGSSERSVMQSVVMRAAQALLLLGSFITLGSVTLHAAKNKRARGIACAQLEMCSQRQGFHSGLASDLTAETRSARPSLPGEQGVEDRFRVDLLRFLHPVRQRDLVSPHVLVQLRNLRGPQGGQRCARGRPASARAAGPQVLAVAGTGSTDSQLTTLRINLGDRVA